MTRRLPLWLTFGAAIAAVSLVGGDLAEAKKTRRPRGRKPHRFLSAPAPSKGRTPEIDASGAPAAASRDVAGAALEAPSGQKTLQGGTAIVLSPTRALVANPWRGLAVVDTTDPADPKILGSVALDGSADRVFVDGTTALVVSRTWDAAGGGTKVTAVDLTDESHPAVAGVASVAGDLVAVEESGGDLVVVTSAFSYGPWVMAGGNGGGGVTDALGAPNIRKTRAAKNGASGDAAGASIAPDFWNPRGGDDKVRVARIVVGADGAPSVAGELALDGVLVANSIDGDGVVLALDRTTWGWPGPLADANTLGAPSIAILPGDGPTGGIELTSVDASGAPSLGGKAVLSGISGVSALNVAGGVARVVGWSVDGTPTVATFQLGSGDPAPLGSATLPGWPEASVFAGDRFVWSRTTWDVGTFEDGTVVKGDPNGTPGRGTTPAADPAYSGPTTTLHVVDLSDAAHPGVGGSLDIGTGWTAGLQAAGDDVVATVSEWNETTGATHVLRVDLSDAAKPVVAASVDLDGSWYGSITAGDLLLLSGGVSTEDGAWLPRVVPVSLAGDGLAAGAPFDAGSWIAAAAWSAPILAAGSTDAVRFFDLSDMAKPVALGSVRLAVNVADLTVLGDSAAACLVTDWVGGAIEVRTVSLPAADALAPLDTVTLGTGDARLFRDGSMLYVLSTDWSTGRGGLTVVDATDPSDLRVRGSLDLANYPGQAFLVNGSMVLLREAWSLTATDEESGKTKLLGDAFGRCRWSWLRDDLSAVLDVVDLSDPDAPRAAARKRLRWDYGGEAILRGSTLYVPSYVTVGVSPEGWERYAYGVRGIDLSTPLSPRVGRLVEVPGTLVAAADSAGRVLTVSYDYEGTTGGFAATLHLVDLTSTDWRARVVADHELAGSPGAVVTGADHAYVTTESWNQETGASTSALDALRLSDLSEASTQTRDRSSWGGTISGGCLFLRSWGWTGALDAYSLGDPAAPAFVVSASLDGVGTTVGVAGGRAYVPAGWRGVASFDLKK